MLKNIEPISNSSKGSLDKNKNVTELCFPLSMLGYKWEQDNALETKDSEKGNKNFVVKYVK